MRIIETMQKKLQIREELNDGMIKPEDAYFITFILILINFSFELKKICEFRYKLQKHRKHYHCPICKEGKLKWNTEKHINKR